MGGGGDCFEGKRGEETCGQQDLKDDLERDGERCDMNMKLQLAAGEPSG